MSATGHPSLFANIRIAVDGDGVRTFAVAARENMDDLRPAFAVITENLRSLARRTFDSEGTALGAAWQPLAAATVRARARGYGYYKGGGQEGPAHKILQWRHVLRDSLTDVDAPGGIASLSATTLIFGTSVPQGAFNQSTRRFLGLPAAFVRTDVLPPIANYLRGADPRGGQGRRRTQRAASAFRAVA